MRLSGLQLEGWHSSDLTTMRPSKFEHISLPEWIGQQKSTTVFPNTTSIKFRTQEVRYGTSSKSFLPLVVFLYNFCRSEGLMYFTSAPEQYETICPAVKSIPTLNSKGKITTEQLEQTEGQEGLPSLKHGQAYCNHLLSPMLLVDVAQPGASLNPSATERPGTR